MKFLLSPSAPSSSGIDPSQVKAQTITIVPPVKIIADTVRPAIKHLIPKLRAAAELDRKLTDHRNAAHPDGAVAEAEQVVAAAINGDPDAERRLAEAGGAAGFIAQAREVYNVREAARHRAALSNLELMIAYAEAAKPAVAAAGEKIQDQHNGILRALGEPQGESEQWRFNVAVILRELNRIEGLVRDGDGADGLIGLPAFGFREIVMGEGK